jgi:hypothetical protein
MKKALIVTDCKGTKIEALNLVCIGHLGRHNFEFIFLENKDKEEVPKSFEELKTKVEKRIDLLCKNFDPGGLKEEAGEAQHVYYASLQKGFLPLTGPYWLLTAMAQFGKFPGYIYSGMSESVPLDRMIGRYIKLPEEERYKKFNEVYPLFNKTPLITCINGMQQEADWYKQAFRNCISAALRS